MHIPREIRKKLERSLSSDVLDFLNEKFEEAEKYCEKAKDLEKENKALNAQVHQMLYSVMSKMGSQGGGMSQMGGQMGYGQHVPMEGMTNRYKPWEYEEEDYDLVPEYRRGGNRNAYMRRGVPGTGTKSQGQGGGQGGSGSGQGGAGTAGAEYDYVPEPERLRKVHDPIVVPLDPQS